MRTRIYKTGRMKNGNKVVFSGSAGEWFVFGIIKWFCKALFFCMFFWIIIPIKLLKKK